MKVKKTLVLAGVVLLLGEGYCGLEYEAELAEKFCPSLQLHSKDQGVSPKPVEIMANKKVSYLTEHDLYVRVFNELGQFVGEWDIDAGFESHSIIGWPLSLYATLYGPKPLTWTGKIPGGKSKQIYHLIFHYDFGGPGRDSPSTWYSDYHRLSGLYNDTIYAHIFPLGDKAVIQYWFFYPFNDWVNNHEGDWEHINVCVSSQDPATAKIEYVDYYFHHHVIRCTKPGIDFFVDDETHPVVFVGGHGSKKGHSGEGSHGSYPVKGHWSNVVNKEYLFDLIDIEIDETIDGSGEFLSYKTFDIKLLPNREDVTPEDVELYWMRPNIPWGHVQCDSPGDWVKNFVGPEDVGQYAPEGPPFKKSWNDTGDTPSDEYDWYPKSPPYHPVTNSGYKIPEVGIIKGRVTDKDGKPLSCATIKVVGRNRSATTGKDGYYRIALPVGTYKLQAGKKGYGKDVVLVTLDPDDEVTANFSLGTNYILSPAPEEEIERLQTASGKSPGRFGWVWNGGNVYTVVEAEISYGKTFTEPPNPSVSYNHGGYVHILDKTCSGCKARVYTSIAYPGNMWFFWKVKGVVKYIKITGKVVSTTGYRLEYGEGESPTSWTTIKEVSGSVKIVNGLLDEWDIEGLPDARYTLRLKIEGNIEDQITVTLGEPDLTPPVIITPKHIKAAIGEQVKLTAYVKDDKSGVKSVTIDLSSIGGPSDQPMADDGNYGDEEAGDGTYTYTYTIPASIPEGEAVLCITAEDKASNLQTASLKIEIAPARPMRRLTTLSGVEVSADFSPDGKMVVFHNLLPGGNVSLWIMDSDGRNQRKLSLGKEGYNPRFSPNGKMLAFHSGTDIWIVTNIDEVIAKGASAKFIKIDNGGHENAPSWSPDGSMLGFYSDFDLWVVINIHEMIKDDLFPILKQISDTKRREYNLIWSPDGRCAAIDQSDGVVGGKGEMYIIKNIEEVIKNDAVPDLSQLTNGSGLDFPAGFSPDARLLFFSSTRGRGTYDYAPWVITNIEDVVEKGAPPEMAQLTSPPPLPANGERIDAISPDGTKLILASTRGGDDLWDTDLWITDYLYDESAFPSANITHPILDQKVSGQVEIKGTAKDNISVDGETILSKLSHYVVEYGEGEEPEAWKQITRSEEQIDNGILALWDTTALPDGVYTIKLTAADGDDENSQKIRVKVENQKGYFENFENGAEGWKATGLWHLEKKRSNSGKFSFAYNNGVNYNTGRRNYGYIQSPEIDLMSASSAKLSFYTFWQHESYPFGFYDNMKVEVYDGAWHQIFYNDCNEGPSYSNWHKEEFDISRYCGKKIKLRFSFDTVDRLYNNYEGWYIDDVKVDITPIPPPIFTEDFDDGEKDGWSFSGLWHISSKRSDTPKFSIAYNNGKDYNVGRTKGGAESPIIDLSNIDKAYLSFASWYETEYSSYWDRKELHIATEDGNYLNWKKLLQITGTRRTWKSYTVDLTQYCGKRIKLRFWFDSIDGILNRYEGWYVDSIKIEKGEKKTKSIQSAPQILSILNRRAESSFSLIDKLPDFEQVMAEAAIDSKKEIERIERKPSAQLKLREILREGDITEIEVRIERTEILGAEIEFKLRGIEILSLIPLSDIKGFYTVQGNSLSVQIIGPAEGSLFKIRAEISAPAEIRIKSADVRDIANQRAEAKLDSLILKGLISQLLSPYPNPAEDGAYIPFTLSEDSDVKVEIYNILGQRIRTIDVGYKRAGSYTKADRAIHWDRRNDKGERVSSGLYFIKLSTKSFSEKRPLILR